MPLAPVLALLRGDEDERGGRSHVPDVPAEEVDVGVGGVELVAAVELAVAEAVRDA